MKNADVRDDKEAGATLHRILFLTNDKLFNFWRRFLERRLWIFGGLDARAAPQRLKPEFPGLNGTAGSRALPKPILTILCIGSHSPWASRLCNGMLPGTAACWRLRRWCGIFPGNADL